MTMALPKIAARLTAAEYLQIERAAPYKSEFHDGEMFAMAGASPMHNRIAANLIREFGNQLEGKPCEAFTSDLRVRVEAAGLYTYPDLSVGCPPEFGDGDNLLNPSVLVEILSDSTEAFDRGKKWEMYRQIPSLQEFLLVSQHKPHIEHFVRQAGGQWLLSDVIGMSATLTVVSIGVTLALSKIYARVTFPPVAVPDPPVQG